MNARLPEIGSWFGPGQLTDMGRDSSRKTAINGGRDIDLNIDPSMSAVGDMPDMTWQQETIRARHPFPLSLKHDFDAEMGCLSGYLAIV